jgi:hypothetical protein
MPRKNGKKRKVDAKKVAARVKSARVTRRPKPKEKDEPKPAPAPAPEPEREPEPAKSPEPAAPDAENETSGVDRPRLVPHQHRGTGIEQLIKQR